MLEGLKTNSKNLERSEKSILLKGRVLEVNRMLAATVNIDDWLGEKGNTIEVPFRSPVIPRHPSAGKAPEYTFVTRPHFHNRSVALGKVERAISFLKHQSQRICEASRRDDCIME